MAAVTSSDITVIEQHDIVDRGLKYVGTKALVTITVTGEGANAGDIPISAFEGALGRSFETFRSVSPFIADDNSVIVVASPVYDGTSVILKAAATNAGADYTDTFRCVVELNKKDRS